MLTNVLEYLEATVKKNPSKTAYSTGSDGLKFEDVYNNARALGTALHNEGYYKEPIVVFMGKHPNTIATFFGIVYAGCFYVPIDGDMPSHRIELILNNLKPRAIICDESTEEYATNNLFSLAKIYSYKDLIQTTANANILLEIRSKSIDIDPVYVVFTSGSTGVPKGVVACHRSIVDYIENLSDILEINENTIFGNQSPLYFDACLKEIYPTLKFGASTYLIPKKLFMFPVMLVNYLNDHKINTLCWVSSALSYVSALGAFRKVTPKHLHTIAFGSEVFPIKQLATWRHTLPEAKFINLYGPTEATGMSCYYKLEGDLGEVVPIGKPFKNTEVLLLDSSNKLVKPRETGEICIRGTALTLGYYNEFEKTQEAFIQNPLNNAYPELIYKTGDLGRYNDKGELIFVSRIDSQIKHMGYRIELGEIEATAQMIDEVTSAACLFDKNRNKIILFYTGEAEESEIIEFIKSKLPSYMTPNIINRLYAMPLTANGKIDRVSLKNIIGGKNKDGRIN